MQQWNVLVVYEKYLHLFNGHDLQTLALPVPIIWQKILSWETNKITSSLKIRKGIHFILSLYIVSF